MRRPRFFLNTILGVVIGAAACSGDSSGPAEPMAPSMGLIKDLAKGLGDLTSAVLLKCTPLTYTSKGTVVGKEGGVVQIGPHSLVIPQNALKDNVAITGEVVSGEENSVRFSPEGLRFKRAATLRMSYSNCNGLGSLLPKKIVYTDELLKLLEILKSVDLSSEKVVTTELEHFSRYAIAY